MTNIVFHIRKISFQLLAFLSWMLLFSTDIFSQCAMCKGQLESHGDNGTSLAVNSGILYLLLMPFLFAGFIGFMFYKKSKQKDDN